MLGPLMAGRCKHQALPEDDHRAERPEAFQRADVNRARMLEDAGVPQNVPRARHPRMRHARVHARRILRERERAFSLYRIRHELRIEGFAAHAVVRDGGERRIALVLRDIKKATGLSMRDYRKRNREPPDD